jgi:hypothetical protein
MTFINVTFVMVLLQMHSSLDEHLYEINYKTVWPVLKKTHCILYSHSGLQWRVAKFLENFKLF